MIPDWPVIPEPFAAWIAIRAPGWLALGLALAGGVLAVALIRRPRMPAASGALMMIGALCLALAGGDPAWQRPLPQRVSVMVDLSPSTRGARYRDARWLAQRIDALLGDAPRRLIFFAAGNVDATLPDGRLDDLPAEQTVFAPPLDGPVLLFSDGRFEPPAVSPPIYPVIDPLLQSPGDAAIARLQVRDRELAAHVVNHGEEPRRLQWLPTGSTVSIPSGRTVVSAALPADLTVVGAQLDQGDLWPENDRLELTIPPPPASQRWWVGDAAPPGWRGLAGAELPLDPAAYLAPAVIVLNNVAAWQVPTAQQQRLAQYVRDLGGSLVIVGGERAFAAGAYPGTLLESLSPLSSSPPQPAIHWLLVADSSGSMAADAGGATRWELARQALLAVVPHIPPEDPLSIGSFARDLRWWSSGRSARETALLSLPPPDVRPTGPTNLQAALQHIIAEEGGGMPRELLLLSDTDADVDAPALLDGLRAARIRLHVLAIGRGRGLAALSQLADATGGRIMEALEPATWMKATLELFQRAAPAHVQRGELEIRLRGPLAPLGLRRADLWNRTWLKSDATAAGEAATPDGDVVMAAVWNFGSGQVLAAAFPADSADVLSMSGIVARPPRDPRLRVTFDAAALLKVTVDAIDGQQYLNGLELRLQVLGADDTSREELLLTQVAPGRYEAVLPAPRRPAFATLWHEQRVVDQAAIAGRYAPEFDEVGTDADALRELAARSGGVVVAPSDAGPIDCRWPLAAVALRSVLAALAGAMIGLALVWWQVS